MLADGLSKSRGSSAQEAKIRASNRRWLRPENGFWKRLGGGSGIRTHDTVSRIHAFQASALSHSATPPQGKTGRNIAAGTRLTTRASHAESPPPRARLRNFHPLIPLLRQSWRGDTGGSHGTRFIAVAYRHSIADYSSDLGAWRPARVILPSGLRVTRSVLARREPGLFFARFRRTGRYPTLGG